MKLQTVCVLLSATLAAEAQDFLDRIEQALTFSALNDNLRTRVSGTLDLELYHFEQPPPGLINSQSDNLFNPRLTLFVDAQYGAHFYFFAQTRIDRGFDPSDDEPDARLDEYALRFTPWEDGRVTLQLGKFATVIGNFVTRHLSWENPFINAPLVYENVTALEDSTGRVATHFAEALLFEKYEFIPVIWGPSYATGISASGRISQFEYAAEIKNASLSSRPEVWHATEQDFSNPTFNGRVGFRPNQMWNFGLSISDGAYLRDEAQPFLPAGRDLGVYREKLLGQDISFAWHHLQVWAEFYEARFDVPRVGDADTFAWYVEAKYKFAPQLFGALRWNQQFFDKIDSPIPDSGFRLGEDMWRADAALAWRFTPHTQLKLQYSFQKETSRARNANHFLAAQFTVRF